MKKKILFVEVPYGQDLSQIKQQLEELKRFTGINYIIINNNVQKIEITKI